MSVGTLRPADLEALKAVGVSTLILTGNVVRRVTHEEARDLCGIRYKSDHLEGLAFPYLDPEDDRVVTWRVKRDHPEVESDGTPIAKYVSPPDRKHLYFVPGCFPQLSDTTAPAIIVEAEKSVLAIAEARLRINRAPWPLILATGGCWGWRGVTGKATSADGARVDEKGPLPDLGRVTWTGRDTIIVFDANAATNTKVQAARRALAAELAKRGAKVRVAELPTEAGINGPDDYIGQHGASAFWSLIDAATATKATKPEKRDRPLQGRVVQLEDPEPWPDPVDGAALLDAIAATFARYLALPAHASIALALWVLHCFAFEAWFTSPFLAITSPAKRCGKTFLLIVLGALVPRRLFASNVTPAVLFRTIEKYRPVLLIDEADTFIRENDELRGVLNSGHTKTTAVVIRAVGDDHDPRAFSTWCPKAIALIGKLPGTLADRAIEIAMRRRTAGERVERLRQDRIEGECSDLRRQAARWAADHLADLQDADPQVPGVLHDRAVDCWRSLLAISDCVDGDWPTRAREAAKAISGAEDEAEQPVAVLLLDDVRTILGPREELSSADLVKALRALDSRPWATWGRDDKGLTSHALARLMKDFAIHPIKIRFGTETANGYTRRMFEDAWSRYTPARLEQCNNPNNDGLESLISTPEQPEHPRTCSTSENASSTNNDGLCSSVPLKQGGEDEDVAVDHPDFLWRDPEEVEDEDADAYYGGA